MANVGEPRRIIEVTPEPIVVPVPEPEPVKVPEKKEPVKTPA